jgi:putative flippase GtrA
LKALLLRLIRFASVGSMGMGVQVAVLSALTSLAGLHYLLATALAVEAAIVHNFLWHERWTWGDRARRERLRRLLLFQGTTGVVSIAGNLVFMGIFVGGLSMHPLAGNLASVACCAGLNFVLNHKLIFT